MRRTPAARVLAGIVLVSLPAVAAQDAPPPGEDETLADKMEEICPTSRHGTLERELGMQGILTAPTEAESTAPDRCQAARERLTRDWTAHDDALARIRDEIEALDARVVAGGTEPDHAQAVRSAQQELRRLHRDASRHLRAIGELTGKLGALQRRRARGQSCD